ncbi:MAG: phosphatidylglycerophosphatase A [Elusimicrobia bacterium]|nr:phosphatidylglycerophosphatase A [Elusimicrobiota bacterium]
MELSVALATGFYLSYIPVRWLGGLRPKLGTGAGFVGTLEGLLLAAALPERPWAYALFMLAALPFSVWLCGLAEKALGNHDDPRIVLDEMVGYWTALAFLPRTPLVLGLAFVLFRVFDTIKPPPCRRLAKLPGGWGIVADDLAAGALACLLLHAWLACAPAAAQEPIVAPSTPSVSGLGEPLSLEGGPWIIGEVLFLSAGRPAGDYSWRDKVRASHGALYTKTDVLLDAESLMTLGKFEKVAPALYAIADSPVPQDFFGVVSSTSHARLVFNVVEKAAPAAAPIGEKPAPPPSPISGVIFTPTAYRGAGKYGSPGLGLDINGVYVIGRLYGRNSFTNAPRSVNYIDRIGVWLLTADGKMQVQSEGPWRPAVAAGVQGGLLFRDSPQPKVNDPNPTVTVNASQKTTKLLSGAYFAASKKIGPVRTTVGFMQGQMGDMVAQFSEFLTPDALGFYAGRRGQVVSSRSVPFASFMLLPKPQYPLAVEFMKFNGAALNPVMINFKVGYFLKLNFDVGLLKYKGGYDILGLLQFRYNHFPKK